MKENGYIDEVSVTRLGTFLAADASIGDTVLIVETVSDFDDEGGTLSLNGEELAYVTVDFDAETITLTEPLAEAAVSEDEIVVLPESFLKIAAVVTSEEDEPVTAVVSHALWDRIPEGIRLENMEACTIELIDDTWFVVDVQGQAPVIDGNYIDPDTMPPAAPPGPDGEVPQDAPVVSAEGGIGSLFVRWVPIENADQVTYDVYISADPDFVPSDDTLVVSTVGSSASVRTLPNGDPITYDTTYYIKVIPRDEDGPGPTSEPVGATPRQATNEDIASNYVYAGEISVNNLTGGTLTADLNLASTIKTAAAGARVEINSAGIIIYNPEGIPTTSLTNEGTSTFKGNVEAQGMTVHGGASFRSDTNEISSNGKLKLARGTTAPTQTPHVQHYYEQVVVKDASGEYWDSNNTLSGLDYSDGDWLAAGVNNPVIHEWEADGTYVQSHAVPYICSDITRPDADGPIYGVRKSGSVAYLHRLTEADIFADDFSGTLSNWSTVGSPSTSGGQAVFNLANNNEYAIYKTGRSMKSNAVQAKMTLPTDRNAGDSFYMRIITLSGTKLIEMRWSAGLFVCYEDAINRKWVNYDEAIHKYWRIKEEAGTFVCQFKTNEADAWTSLVSIPHTYTDTELSNMTWRIGGTVDDSTSKYLNVDDAKHVQAVQQINIGAATYAPRITTYAGSLRVADGTGTTGAKHPRVKTYSESTLALSAVTSLPDTYYDTGNYLGFYMGGGDFSENSYVFHDVTVGSTDQDKVSVFSVDDGASRSADFFEAADYGQLVGLAYDGTYFWSMSAWGTLYKYQSEAIDSDALLVSYSWADATDETEITSDWEHFTPRRRAGISVYGAELPDPAAGLPDRIKVYMADFVDFTGLNTDWHLQGTSVAGESWVTITEFDDTGASPSLTNSFPELEPAVIESTSPDTLKISADGSIQAVSVNVSDDIDAEGNLYIGGNTNMQGELGVSGALSADSVTVDNDLTVENDLSVESDLTVVGTVIVGGARVMPPGIIQMYAGSTAPTGWAKCEGQVVSRTGTYANLFAAIGTTFNTGGESGTQFRLPDMRRRVPFGTGTSVAVGLNDGLAETSRLATHSHGVGTLDTSTVPHSGASNTQASGGSSTRVSAIDGSQNGTHKHNVTGSTANAQGMPYLALAFIIKL